MKTYYNKTNGLAAMPDKKIKLNIELYQHALDVCGSFNLRKAARAVTQLYDDILQPTGLRSTQIVILLNLAIKEEMVASRVARELHISPSTLTRNLQPLERDGLIKKSKRGQRGKLIRLTPKGAKALENCIPHWVKAQQEFTELVGEIEWDDLRARLAKTVRALRS